MAEFCCVPSSSWKGSNGWPVLAARHAWPTVGRGPGRLTKALQVDLRQDGLDLCAAGPLWLAATAQSTGAIGKSVRIGITRNVHRLLRFYERGNAHVSGPKKLRQ